MLQAPLINDGCSAAISQRLSGKTDCRRECSPAPSSAVGRGERRKKASGRLPLVNTTQIRYQTYLVRLADSLASPARSDATTAPGNNRYCALRVPLPPFVLPPAARSSYTRVFFTARTRASFSLSLSFPPPLSLNAQGISRSCWSLSSGLPHPSGCLSR